MNMEYLFLLSLFFVAFLYSSVGHGGASGYLALMALFSFLPETIKSTALILNIFVSAIALISFYRGGFFKWKIAFPFLITSIPFAFMASVITIEPYTYKIILGVFLIIAVGRMLLMPKLTNETTRIVPIIPALLIGAVLGFFSGMIGIGGGIILSPLLILLSWASLKEAAAASAIFIFFNSLAGLFGVLKTGVLLNSNIVLWIIIAVIGGFAGSYSGTFKIASDKLKYILALVLLMASFKLIII